MTTTVSLVSIHRLISDTKKKKEKQKVFFLVMTTFRIYSFRKFQIYSPVVLTIVIMLYITSLFSMYKIL